MNDGLDGVGCTRRAHHHVPQLTRPRNGSRPVDRKGEHVGRLISPSLLSVQPPHLRLVDEGEREVPVLHLTRAERRLRRFAHASIRRPADLDLERYRPLRSVYSLYAFTIRCTSLWRTTSSPPKRTNSIPSTSDRMSPITTRPERWSLSRSICVMSPVTTIFELNPSRVRNIFICSGLVFCASSRMMNESLSVRPRMKASGAISMAPRSRCWFTRSGSSMS